MPYFLSVTDAAGNVVARDTAPDSHTYAQLVDQLVGLMGARGFYCGVYFHTANGEIAGLKVRPEGRDAPPIEGLVIWRDDETQP